MNSHLISHHLKLATVHVFDVIFNPVIWEFSAPSMT